MAPRPGSTPTSMNDPLGPRPLLAAGMAAAFALIGLTSLAFEADGTSGYPVPFLMFLVGCNLVDKGITDVCRYRRVCKWPAVIGRVLRADLHSSSNGDGAVTFRPEVEFEYEAHGVRHLGTRLSVDSCSGASYSKRIVEFFAPGSQVAVFYDPAAPAQSILLPPHTLMAWSCILMGLEFVIPALAVSVRIALKL